MTTEAPDRMAANHAFAKSFPLQRQGMILYRENFENWIIAGISGNFVVRTAPNIWRELRTKAEGSGSCVHDAAWGCTQSRSNPKHMWSISQESKIKIQYPFGKRWKVRLKQCQRDKSFQASPNRYPRRKSATIGETPLADRRTLVWGESIRRRCFFIFLKWSTNHCPKKLKIGGSYRWKNWLLLSPEKA